MGSILLLLKTPELQIKEINVTEELAKDIQAEKPVEEKPPEENIDDLKKALAAEKARAEANLSGWQRAQADFVNYKRFVEQDKAESVKYANTTLLLNVLPFLDDLDRALAAVPPKEQHHKWVEGFKMIDKKFRMILEKLEVKPILSLGMEYDYRTMEAVTSTKGKKDMVIQELERGYKLQDKVIRPAKVVVGNGEEPSDKEG
jgi:molecular chaperone GrpE